MDRAIKKFAGDLVRSVLQQQDCPKYVDKQKWPISIHCHLNGTHSSGTYVLRGWITTSFTYLPCLKEHWILKELCWNQRNRWPFYLKINALNLIMSTVIMLISPLCANFLALNLVLLSKWSHHMFEVHHLTRFQKLKNISFIYILMIFIAF